MTLRIIQIDKPGLSIFLQCGGQFMWIVVGACFVRTALGDCFCSLHHKRATDCSVLFFVITRSSRWASLDGVFALWITRTTIKYAKSPLSFAHKSFVALRAQNSG